MDDLWIGDKLPTIYEVAQTIFHYSKKIKSQKRISIIKSYARAVGNLWIRSFTVKFVISLSSVIRRVEKIMQDYESRVRCSHDKSPWRVRNKLWMDMDVSQPKREPLIHAKNSSLFDIGKDTQKLTGDEKNLLWWYIHQKNLRNKKKKFQ